MPWISTWPKNLNGNTTSCLRISWRWIPRRKKYKFRYRDLYRKNMSTASYVHLLFAICRPSQSSVISSRPSFAMCCLNRPSVLRAIAPSRKIQCRHWIQKVRCKPTQSTISWEKSDQNKLLHQYHRKLPAFQLYLKSTESLLQNCTNISPFPGYVRYEIKTRLLRSITSVVS
jgi:hypothetical protein